MAKMFLCCSRFECGNLAELMQIKPTSLISTRGKYFTIGKKISPPVAFYPFAVY